MAQAEVETDVMRVDLGEEAFLAIRRDGGEGRVTLWDRRRGFLGLVSETLAVGREMETDELGAMLAQAYQIKLDDQGLTNILTFLGKEVVMHER